MTKGTANIISFPPFEVDLSRRELRANGVPVDIEPQVLDLIAYFAEHQGRVLNRDEIVDAIWEGRIVSDMAISTKIKVARKALGDDGTKQQMIKTIPRRGFLFVPQVTIGAQSVEPGPEQPSRATANAQVAAGQKPSIVVLPFKNLSGDPEQSYFSDGIAEDVITDLSRYSELKVIAHHSAFAFHNRAETGLEFARELGVAYLAEGSVRRSTSKVRVTVQLVDVATGETLWAEKFDRRVEDVLDVQEEVATVIVNILAGQVQQRHYRRLLGRGERSTSAYDHALKAQQHLWRFSRVGLVLARQEAEKAVQLDPLLARAHATLAWACHAQATNGWEPNIEEAIDRARTSAQAAIEADANEPWGYNILALSFWWNNKEPDFNRADEMIRRSIRLNPSNAHMIAHRGAMLPFAGRGDEALLELDRAMQLNPLYPAMYLEHRSRAHFVEARYEASLANAQRASVELPGFTNVLAMLAVGYEKLGRHEEAAQTVEELNRVSPSFSVGFVRRTVPYAQEVHRDAVCELLARAGLAE